MFFLCIVITYLFSVILVVDPEEDVADPTAATCAAAANAAAFNENIRRWQHSKPLRDTLPDVNLEIFLRGVALKAEVTRQMQMRTTGRLRGRA